MQCGPVRYRVSAKAQAATRPFEHTVIVRPTAFVSRSHASSDKRTNGPQVGRSYAPGDRSVSQENGYLVLRFLAEDVAKDLDTVLDAILRSMTRRLMLRLNPREG